MESFGVDVFFSLKVPMSLWFFSHFDYVPSETLCTHTFHEFKMNDFVKLRFLTCSTMEMRRYSTQTSNFHLHIMLTKNTMI